MVMNKVGDEKYYIIISMILGLIVLALSLYFIFQEYFNEDEISWESCRQSIVLRQSIPRQEAFFEDVASLREDLPLKCRAEIVEIDYENVTRLEYEFVDTLRKCWVLFGEGQSEFFPVTKWHTNSYCLPCARIHITPKVEEFYKENVPNIQRALGRKVPGMDVRYIDYFQRENSEHVAFSYIAEPTWADEFSMKKYDKELANYIFDVGVFRFAPWADKSKNLIRMQLPGKWDVKKSSEMLVIIYQVVANFDDKGEELKQDHQTHMAFMAPEDIAKTSMGGFYGVGNKGAMCEKWEGIPA